MGDINICNKAGLDAVVNTESVHSRIRVRWLDPQDRQAASVRVIKSTVDQDLDAITDRCGGLDGVAQALIDDDPEVDIERVGSFLRETSRVFIDSERQLVHKVHRWEIVRNPDGSERERRPRAVLAQNVAEDAPPLRWSGVLIKKEEACRKFVFSGKLQLVHINGLTYDFLHGIASELEKEQSLMLLGAGSKSNQPLVLRRGGSPYRGFLEGRTDGRKYALILHLSNLELKDPQDES